MMGFVESRVRYFLMLKAIGSWVIKDFVLGIFHYFSLWSNSIELITIYFFGGMDSNWKILTLIF